MQDEFNKMCLLMAADALSAYPDDNKRFAIFTNLSDDQMGACIMQEGFLVTYYSKKLYSAQKKLHHNGKRNVVNRCNSQRVPIHAPQCLHPCLHQSQEFNL